MHDDDGGQGGPTMPGEEASRMMDAEGSGIEIAASDDELKGRYANLMSVSHTGEEFVLDFFSVAPQGNVARGSLVARVITSPAHFKRVVAALQDNLDKYESQFGEIDEARTPMPNPEDIGFVH